MLKKSIFLSIIILSAFTAILAQEETEPAAISSITESKLPAGAMRVLPASIPNEINEAFESLVATSKERLVGGEREVLVWTKNSKKASATGFLTGKIRNEWQASGWNYEASGKGDEKLEFFGLFTQEPKRRAVLGFFVEDDEALILALTEVFASGAEKTHAAGRKNNSPPIDSGAKNNSSAKILDVGKDDGFVNVMGSEMPALPAFSALKPKAGFVRGFVKDWTGKPLQGAAIGVRSSYLAGMYSGAQGKTDAKGYYEFSVPKGSAHFYNAGYALEWGEGGLAALGLHPADGTLDSFVTMDGAVENFVLLPYGITSRAKAQENPRLAASYYGGSLSIGYAAFEASDNRPPAHAIPENSILEITLVPEDEMFGAVAAQTFIIRKKAGFQSYFRINNIPLGRYRIRAKVGGKSLKLKLNSPSGSVFGMMPNETNDAASIIFAPASAQANMVVPQAGGWDSVEISVERP